LLLFPVAFVALVRTRRSLTNLTFGLGVAATVLSGVALVKVVSYQSGHPPIRLSDQRLWPTALSPPARKAGARPPDIYVIIPDDYARGDVLRRYFRYDNAAFAAALRRRGFVISENGRSPYSDSESNIAAALNMDYLSGLSRILGQRSQDVRPLKTLIEQNRAAQLLKPLGYRYVHLDSDEVTYAAGNPDISPVSTPDSFTSLWLKKSVLSEVGGPFGFNRDAANARYRGTLRSAFARLAAVPAAPSPKFVVFHTLLPHDPYVLGRRGEPVTFPSQSEDALGAKLGMRYYLAQLRGLEGRLLQAVDTIRARSRRPPVIVIQSDEGFEANPEYLGEAAMRDVRVKGLTAVYMPGIERPRAPSPPTTVNTLRYVMNSYFGTRYPLLPAASYPETDFPYQYEEMRVR
jgi:hypothetical protein